MPKTTYFSLMDAIQSNDLNTFRSILESENATQQGLWWTDYDLLKHAMALGRKHVVDYLLLKGCCVWKPRDKPSPLHVAVAKDWHDVVNKLLCLGARASARDEAGDTTVHLAFKNQAPCEILDLLIESYLDETTVSVKDKEDLGVLHIVCTRPNLQLVKQFFQFHQTSIDSQVSLKSNSPHAGYTPMHFAVEHGRHEVVAYLLERGADMYRQDRNGSTPLHLALEYCDIKMVNLICYYVSKFENIVNSRGLSHFMAACASNDPSLVEKYLSEASHPLLLINTQVNDVAGYPFAGYTPLHFAAVHDRVHIARLLLYVDGDELFWAATARNHTAASLAFESNRFRVTKLFSAYCEGDDAWENELKKIGEGSVVRKIMEKDDSFVSCCDVGVIIEGNFESESVREVAENLDDTLPIEDYSSDEDEYENVHVVEEEVGEREAPIHDTTPKSTRSVYGMRDEALLTRIQEVRRMSRRLFFNVDREEDEQSDRPSFLRILLAIRPVRVLMGSLLLIPLVVNYLYM